ncbi:MAG: threonine/serine dehydratase [Candidatus Hodarchaeota archaeon]
MRDKRDLSINVKKEVLDAERRIRKYIRETPLEYSPYLSKLEVNNVFLKLENTQITGSFKLRGAFNKLLSLTEQEKTNGIITASTGNHGLAVAYALKTLGGRGTIFVPENSSRSKLEALRHYDVSIEFYGKDCEETETFARATAQNHNQIFISPYNDPRIIGGQGTIGIELMRQLENIDVVFVAVGGGGLASGLAGYLKSVNENIKVVGCLPQNSPVMYESIKAGRIITMESKPTLSDGTAGGIEENAITFNLCKTYVDDFVLITESEIKEALVLMLDKHHLLMEGAAGLVVAAFLKKKKQFKKKNVVLIICGANIGLTTLKGILCVA